jgi:hypothetical protein
MSQPPSGDRRWNAAARALNPQQDAEELRFVPSSVGSGGNYSQRAHITIISFAAKVKKTRPFRRSRVMLFINMNLNPAHRAMLAVQC